MTYSVKEIYFTLQGEGAQGGKDGGGGDAAGGAKTECVAQRAFGRARR